MRVTSTGRRRRGARLRGLLALTVLALLAFVILGRRYQTASVSRPARTEKPATAATQKALEATTTNYFAAMRRGQYAHALTFCAAGFRSSQSPDTFREILQREYQPFLNVDRPLQFQPAQDGGDMVMLPVQMHCRDGHPYRTYLFWQREEGRWRLGRIGSLMRADMSQLMTPY